MRGAVPRQPVDDALAAESGRHLHEMVRILVHRTDRYRTLPERMRAHRASAFSSSSAATITTSLPSLAT